MTPAFARLGERYSLAPNALSALPGQLLMKEPSTNNPDILLQLAQTSSVRHKSGKWSPPSASGQMCSLVNSSLSRSRCRFSCPILFGFPLHRRRIRVLELEPQASDALGRDLGSIISRRFLRCSIDDRSGPTVKTPAEILALARAAYPPSPQLKRE